MIMEKTLQVLKGALRSAGLLTRVVLVENFVDNEIVIKFPKRAAARNYAQIDLVHVAFEPKVEPVIDLEEENNDSPNEDDFVFEPADSTSQEALSLNQSMVAESADTSSNAPYVKLERLHCKPKSRLPITPNVRFDVRTDNDDGDVGDNENFGDDGDDGDTDFVLEVGDPSLESDPSYNTDHTDHTDQSVKKPKKRKKSTLKLAIPKPPKERKVARERQLLPYLECSLCDYRNKSLTILQRHILMKHSTEKPYKCSLCKFRTSVEPYLLRHMKKHPELLPWKCDACDHRSRLASELARHKTVVHEKPKSYKCQSCSFLGTNRAQFYRHVKCHVSNEETGTPASHHDDHDHDHGNHHDETDIHCMLNTTESVSRMCDLCGRKFQSGLWLEQHMKQHSDPEKYSLLCSHCDRKYHNKTSLKSHLNSLTGEAPFKCRPCDTDLAYDNDLASSTAIAYSEQPKLLQSNRGSIQIHDRGYILCVNKPTKNNHTYFRCISRDTKLRCKATMSVEGPLEEGKFKILFHSLDKHNHEPCTMTSLDKQFNALFKDACLEKLDVPIPTIFEIVKNDFLTTLPPSDQDLYLERLSCTAKNKFMVGYRLREGAGERGPANDCAVETNENDIMLLDDLSEF